MTENQARKVIPSQGNAAAVSRKTVGQPHLDWQTGSFSAIPPSPLPIVRINITTMHATHERLGKRWKGNRRGIFDPTETEAIADTGCQTCTAGLEILELLNCPESYLVPSSHKIVGITHTSLGIVGTLFLRISVGDRVTRQMVYISRNIKGIFLSRTSLQDLGIIDRTFPSPRRATEETKALKSQLNNVSPCRCPKRTTTPDRPEFVPFPATTDNIPRLKEWLLEQFRSSAFNTCTYQPLQEMKGAPVTASFKEGSLPHAVHTPIPVPHHWKKQVKEDIDRDVRLGIIEPVPQGTQTTWCSRMIITPKKDGTPRRTVDLQKLNNATSRETHHTPSAFNLVSTIPKKKLKSVLDAWNGYHSLPLDPTAKEATTFITEWGGIAT